MATPEWLNDDYVASLLASEATDPSSTRKKPTDKPKPNTRFLKNVIKSTDSHNKALLAKEAAESKARLGVLEQTVETQRLKTNPNAKDIRKRQMAGIHAILGGGPTMKRTRDGESATRPSRTERREERSPRERSEKVHDLVRERGTRSREHGRLRESDSDRENDRERRRGKRSSRRHDSDGEDGHRHSRRREKGRSRSPEERRRRHRRDKDRSRSRSRSPRRRRSRQRSTSPRDASLRRDRTRHKHSSSQQSPPKHQNSPCSASPSPEDPLDSFLGPAPAPKYRGRGTIASSSGIDRRFSASYDPTTDITMEDDDTSALSQQPSKAPHLPADWDDAVEAFRDRQKMRQAQEDRLREAGFKEEEIRKMGGEVVVDAQDVSFQWSKAGEKREWDLGKEGDGEDGLLNRAKWAGGKAKTGLFSADDEF